MASSFIKWLIVTLALIGVTAALWAFLFFQDQLVAARAVAGVGNLLVDGWLIYGLWKWREVPWVRRLGAVLLITLIASLLAGGLWALDARAGAVFVGSAWAMAMLFVLGLWLLRLLLTPGFPVIGVARTVLDEAIRMKTPMVFIIMLMLLVPMLPLFISSDDQLRYQIQSFLSWSMIIVGGMLGLMTIFLSVGTITGEIERRQIFLTLTKPVSRVQYLAGKWLGIATLNLLLVAVSGAAIYAFVMLLAQQPAKTAYDARAVHEQVLVARRTVKPVPPNEQGLSAAFRDRLERLRREEPSTYGNPGDPIETLNPEVRNRVQQQVMTEWYTIGPENRTVYRFSGLDHVPAGTDEVQFRFKPKAATSTPDGFVRFALRLNGRPYINPFDNELRGTPIFKYADNKFHVLPLPIEAVNDRGVLDVEVFNVRLPNAPQPPSLTFNTKDGLEVLYRVGSFEANLARSMTIVWLRLAFLAMLGLAAGTFLGFPVACLLAGLFYIAAAGHGYITESFSYYAAFPHQTLPLWDRIAGIPATIGDQLSQGKVYDAFKVVVRMIGSGFIALVPSFAEHNPTPLLSDGRLVPWPMVGRSALWVGLVWTGVVAVIAWLLFRTREIARVIV